MKKRIWSIALILVMSTMCLFGCGSKEPELADGVYTANFNTDSSMFHANEACDGKGTLTVKDGKMVFHVSLTSKKILNLYVGTADKAEKNEADWLQPIVDTVTYSDGTTEEVNGFDIPVPGIGVEFDCALIGEKGKWYDHKISISDPVLNSGNSNNEAADSGDSGEVINQASVTLEGGSGKASVLSPCEIKYQDGQAIARIEWSSPNYDYMLVGGTKYIPVNTEGNSVFEIPVVFDEKMEVQADTVAMGTPHLIDYTLTFSTYLEAEATQMGISSQTHVTGTNSATGLASVEKESDSLDLMSEYFPDLKLVKTLDLKYAAKFSVDVYDNDVYFLTINDSENFIIIPDEINVPDMRGRDIAVIRTPVCNTYVAASAVMDQYRQLDALEFVKMTGTKAADWSNETIRTKVENNDIVYSGKYSAPDYELLLGMGCDLAVESTMIYHAPEVKEQLERLGIPVLVDYSSYESEPMGRMEWIKLYGVLTGKLEEACEFFEKEDEKYADLCKEASSLQEKPTVAFFYITANGQANIRKPSDYIAKMVGIAGGDYVFKDIETDEDDATSTMNLEMEKFYELAAEADMLIYNSTITGELEAIDELVDKNEILKDFKSVKNGQVWCTDKTMYQETTEIVSIVEDMYSIISRRTDETKYLHILK